MKIDAANKIKSARSRKFLASCGIAGPLIYVAVVAVLGYLYPGYSPVSQTMSELGAADAPYPIVMNVAGLGLLGVLVMAFAAGMFHGFRESRYSMVATVLMAASGASLVMAGIYHSDPNGAATSATGLVHAAFAGTTAASGVASMLAISLAMQKDSRWRGYAAFTITMALLGSVLAALYGFDVIEGWKGALQRASMTVAFVWIEVVSFKLVRLP